MLCWYLQCVSLPRTLACDHSHSKVRLYWYQHGHCLGRIQIGGNNSFMWKNTEKHTTLSAKRPVCVFVLSIDLHTAQRLSLPETTCLRSQTTRCSTCVQQGDLAMMMQRNENTTKKQNIVYDTPIYDIICKTCTATTCVTRSNSCWLVVPGATLRWGFGRRGGRTLERHTNRKNFLSKTPVIYRSYLLYC